LQAEARRSFFCQQAEHYRFAGLGWAGGHQEGQEDWGFVLHAEVYERMNVSGAASYLTKNRATLISLCIVGLLGFATKFYSGPAAAWVNNSFCGVFYEIF
jgi:hypothetical protein